jgi:LAGLIDADG endonuclease
LPRGSARSHRRPAHIGEAFLAQPDGNPEGSPRDPVTTDPKGEVVSLRADDNTPALVEAQGAYGAAVPLDPWYVSGLTEGEGCFCVSFAKRAKLRLGLEVRPSFSLSLNERDSDLLSGLQAFFGCGWIRESRSDRTWKYEVRAIADLSERILPHFERFPLRGNKARSLQGFAAVCQMIEQGDHLQLDGLREIVEIATEINLGKRRYSKEELLRALMR